MKKIENYSNRLLHFELARLQTLFNNNPEIRSRILKRYKEVKTEYEDRKLRITWEEHELDKLLKNEVRENFDKSIEKIKHVLKIVKVQNAVHDVGPLKGESIIGVYTYAVTNGKGIEVAKKSILQFKEEDYVEAYRDVDNKIKILGKADYNIENGKWINKDGKFIFEVEKVVTTGNSEGSYKPIYTEEEEDKNLINLIHKAEKHYIDFRESLKEENVYGVFNTKKNEILGKILWNTKWKKYTFVPFPDTEFSEECLNDIQDFVHELTNSKQKILNREKK